MSTAERQARYVLQRRLKYGCIQCTATAMPGSSRCRECRAKNTAKERERCGYTVGRCGACGGPGHNRRTCERATHRQSAAPKGDE